jgi:hypothetical protein
VDEVFVGEVAVEKVVAVGTPSLDQLSSASVAAGVVISVLVIFLKED